MASYEGEGVVPTRVSEAVEPTDEPAVLPFDLVVRVDDQREEALLLVLPQMDVAQVQPTGGIIGVVCLAPWLGSRIDLSRVRRRRRFRASSRASLC